MPDQTSNILKIVIPVLFPFLLNVIFDRKITVGINQYYADSIKFILDDLYSLLNEIQKHYYTETSRMLEIAFKNLDLNSISDFEFRQFKFDMRKALESVRVLSIFSSKFEMALKFWIIARYLTAIIVIISLLTIGYICLVKPILDNQIVAFINIYTITLFIFMILLCLYTHNIRDKFDLQYSHKRINNDNK